MLVMTDERMLSIGLSTCHDALRKVSTAQHALARPMPWNARASATTVHAVDLHRAVDRPRGMLLVTHQSVRTSSPQRTRLLPIGFGRRSRA